MKRLLSFFFSLLVGVVLFVWITKTVGFEVIKIAFLLFFSWQGILLLLLSLLGVIFGTLKWKEILKKEKIKIPFFELLKLYIIGFSINYLFPMIVFGGEITKAKILREKNLISFEKGMSSVIVDRISDLTSLLFFLLTGVLFFLLDIGLPPKNIGFFLFGFLFFLTTALSFIYFKSSKKESMLRFLGIGKNNVLKIEKETLSFFRTRASIKVFFLSTLRTLFLFLRIWTSIVFLGEEIGVQKAFSSFVFYIIGTKIPIPADVGAHEIIQAFGFRALGISPAIGVALAMIIRGAEIVFSLVGLIFLFGFGWRFLEKFFLREIFKNEEQRNSKNIL